MTGYLDYVAEHGYRIPRHGEVEWNLGEYLDHLSPSSLALLRRCPRQFQQEKLLGHKRRPAEALLVGSAVHAALERNFAAKIDSHEDTSMVELLDWYSEVGFPTTVFAEEQSSEQEAHWDTDPEQARTRGRVMLAEYHGFVSPRIQPIAVEGTVEIDLGAPVPIRGRFDVEEQLRTIDFKTGKRAFRKPKDDWLIQGAVYNAATGKGCEFHSISASEKRNSVTIVTPLESEALLVQLDELELLALRRVIQGLAARACLFMELFGPEQPWPTEGRFHEWACDFCSFRNGCPAWSTP